MQIRFLCSQAKLCNRIQINTQRFFSLFYFSSNALPKVARVCFPSLIPSPPGLILSLLVAFSNAEFIDAIGHDKLFESCATSVEIYVLETFAAVQMTNSPTMPVGDMQNGNDKGERGGTEERGTTIYLKVGTIN